MIGVCQKLCVKRETLGKGEGFSPRGPEGGVQPVLLTRATRKWQGEALKLTLLRYPSTCRVRIVDYLRRSSGTVLKAF